MQVIAIDGPAGAGKSTVARRVAMETGLPYLDTGAMYRCIAFATMRDDIDISNAQAVGEIARSSHIMVEGKRVEIDGVDVSSLIRGPEVSSIASIIAAYSPVRDALREQQRLWIAEHNGGVVEGRDIGTVVFPDATVKIFLTASAQVRARRRVTEIGGDEDQTAASIAQRDHLDSSRVDSPLKPATDAHHVDSSGLSIAEVVDTIVGIFRIASQQVETNQQHG